MLLECCRKFREPENFLFSHSFRRSSTRNFAFAGSPATLKPALSKMQLIIDFRLPLLLGNLPAYILRSPCSDLQRKHFLETNWTTNKFKSSFSQMICLPHMGSTLKGSNIWQLYLFTHFSCDKEASLRDWLPHGPTSLLLSIRLFVGRAGTLQRCQLLSKLSLNRK